MVIQNMVFPNEICKDTELFFRTNGQVEINSVVLKAGEVLSTDTYMNALDIGHWKYYTRISLQYLKLCLSGTFRISLYILQDREEKEILRENCSYASIGIKEIFVPQEYTEGLLFWKITGITDTVFYYGWYENSNADIPNDIKVALNICTFHRNEQIRKNLKILAESDFFHSHTEKSERLQIHVTDNGSDFAEYYFHPHIKIHENYNIGGGTGGFTRGILEANKEFDDFPYSHMVFMDDDVEFFVESFYRLFAFLSFIKKEYEMNPIAGRMFRTDKRGIQYTAVEMWNRGNICHIEENLDMTLRQNLKEEKGVEGDYGGWWFCCYPAIVTRKERPFPFFLHCDDVEYGLRQKKKALILRGVQVWHETFEHRINPPIMYYDVRNTLIVNSISEFFGDYEELCKEWRQKVTYYHNQNNQSMKFMCILAMWDFLGGNVGKKRYGKISDVGIRISKREREMRVLSPLLRRLTEQRIKAGFYKTVKKYKERIEKEVWQ